MKQSSTTQLFLRLLFVFLLIQISSVGYAQFWREQDQFGKNRVQYKDFRWRFISTANFDVYYYDDGYEIATLAARYAEEDFSRVTDLVGFSPYNKVTVLVYNSITDLQQSNIGVKHQEFARGGQTNFVRSDIQVAFTGNKYQFKNELALALADILIFEMMYGGNLKELLQSSYLLNLPDWFLSGAASYIAFGWNQEMDRFMADLLTNRKFKKPDHLEGEDARLVGHAIWNYIGEKYGQASIANILNLTRILRNEENSIENVLNIKNKVLLAEWKAFYQQQIDGIKNDLEFPKDEQLFKKNKHELIYNNIKISPNGKKLAYTDNHKGRYKVKVYDTKTHKTKTIFRAGYKLINQKLDKELPLIAWRKKEELAILGTKNGKNYLWFYDLTKRWWQKKPKRQMSKLNNVNGFDISKNGNKFVITGERLGKSAVLIYNFRRRNFQKITSDQFDYLHPKFDKKKNTIIFSSNRQIVRKDEHGKNRLLVETPDKFSLYEVNLRTPSVIKRLTTTLSMDFRPTALNKKEILFLSDQKGIFHLYKYNTETQITIQLTKYQQNIKDYEIVGKDLYIIMNKGGKEHIYKLENFDFDQPVLTPKTGRQTVVEVRYIQEMRKKKKKLEQFQKLKEEREKQALLLQQQQDAIAKAQALADSIFFAQQDSILLNTPDTINIDSLNNNPSDSLANDEIDTDEVGLEDDSDDSFLDDDDEIDTDNYKFDTFSKTKRSKFLDKFSGINKKEGLDEAGKEVVKITRSVDYESRFSLDNVVTSLLIDPLRGFNFVMEASMTDVFENHKINAGIFGLSNLSQSNFFVQYEFLKKRFDFRGKYERQFLSMQTENAEHNYVMNIFQASISYPFNITSRLTITPFYANTRFINLQALSIPDEVEQYAGSNIEFVYDRSLITGLNMRQGTRFKIRLERYIGLNNSDRNFGNLSFDFRNYKRLYRSIIFATRVGYGQFFGNAKKNYLLGGAQNWLFNKTKEHKNATDNPLAVNPETSNVDQLFMKYVTPLRGFDYNKWYGNKYLVLNAELRFPLVKVFSHKTITSNFLRNLQLVAFTDIGSTWTGLSPFNKENSLTTEIIQVDPFVARVSNFQNPFLIGYGSGIRTMFLGYYTKFDVAWGLQNYKTRPKPKYYFTIGHDF